LIRNLQFIKIEKARAEKIEGNMFRDISGKVKWFEISDDTNVNEKT